MKYILQSIFYNMKFVILNTAEAKAHGITIIPTMRQSADNSQVVLHDEYIRSIDEFESLPKYDYDSSEFLQLMNSKEWKHDEHYVAPDSNYSKIVAIRELNKEVTRDINTYNLNPKDALDVKEFYPAWAIGIEVKVGERYLSDNTLWECIKAHTTQEDWKPGISTASLWKEVNVEHSGTQDDPIPYNNNMELVKDKYYIQHDIVYLCTRSTEQPVYNDLKDLVGIYVKAMNLI